MVRKAFLFVVLALALSGAAFADSGNINDFNGGIPRPQSSLKTNSFTPGFYSSYGSDGSNTLFFSEIFDGINIQFIVNTNRGYFNGFTYAFGNSIVATPEPGSYALLAMSLLGLGTAFAFRKKLSLQTSI
ncbi:MAG TPA: PEP-CTERM sorting domain-containing protein [Terriglobales bacterium]|jgi:hypothetical protein